MKNLIAGIALSTLASPLFAGGLLFSVTSSSDSLNVPITLCLSGLAKMSCQNYSVIGYDLMIQTRTKNTTSFPNAGIKVNTTGYKLTDCVANSNGYCIFAANSYSPVHIGLR